MGFAVSLPRLDGPHFQTHPGPMSQNAAVWRTQLRTWNICFLARDTFKQRAITDVGLQWPFSCSRLVRPGIDPLVGRNERESI